MFTDFPLPYITKHLYLLFLDQQEEALDLINQSIQMDPKNPFALRNKGIYYVIKGDKISALQYLTELARDYPDMDLVAEYYSKVHGERPFTPGETMVNYAGRVFDAQEMQNMTSAVLRRLSPSQAGSPGRDLRLHAVGTRAQRRGATCQARRLKVEPPSPGPAAFVGGTCRGGGRSCWRPWTAKGVKIRVGS